MVTSARSRDVADACSPIAQQSAENTEYVRGLLSQRQPGFYAALELAVALADLELWPPPLPRETSAASPGSLPPRTVGGSWWRHSPGSSSPIWPTTGIPSPCCWRRGLPGALSRSWPPHSREPRCRGHACTTSPVGRDPGTEAGEPCAG